LRAVAGAPTFPDHLPSFFQIMGVLSGAVLPLAGIAEIFVGLAWLLWLWVMASLGLELLLVTAESAARGAAWVRGLRRIADRLSMPLARRAVAAAFALQVLSRTVPAAAAPLPTEEAWAVGAGEAEPPNDVRAPSAAYRVRAGDTLWSIAEAAYGSGIEYRRLVSANLGRRMTDGEVFSARGVIRPGWVLDVPEPSRWIDSANGQRWYTVQAGETLSGIAARVLGNPDRWTELFELNRDVATLDDGRTLAKPELIWPGLRLRLPDDAHITVDAPPHALLSAASAPFAIADPPFEVPASTVEAARRADIQPAHDPEAAPDQLPPLVRELHAVPPYEADTDSVPQGELPGLPDESPAPPGIPVAAAVGLVGLVGLVGVTGLAAVGARRQRRLRPPPQEPESEVVVEGGYAAAQLTHEFARQLQGGVAFDAASAQVRQLLQLMDEFNLVGVQPVALRHGRSSTTISLAAKLSDQPLLLDLAPVLAERLQAEAEAWVSNDQDVQLRLVRARKTRLLPVLDNPPKHGLPWFVPLGVLYDRQVFSAAWPAVGHLLVASLPARGADTILTSLLATATAYRSPHELRVWIVGRHRSLPAPLEQLPHLDATI
ncbi:MAG TPA: LysM peptidoglycan-binding domain-containing protein, partial [Chloroflexota bacterium]|nr:LysM peptidoglycan-binding domain-containing protein [Chloroflexota bacterium]